MGTLKHVIAVSVFTTLLIVFVTMWVSVGLPFDPKFVGDAITVAHTVEAVSIGIPAICTGVLLGVSQHDSWVVDLGIFLGMVALGYFATFCTPVGVIAAFVT